MRILVLFILIFARTAWSSSEANCHLVDNGIYQNSKNAIQDIKFEALVDIFSLAAAKTISFKLDGLAYRFHRQNLDVDNYTIMNFETIGQKMKTTAIVHIDRKPLEAIKDKGFNGNIVIENRIHFRRPLTYNFYCSF